MSEFGTWLKEQMSLKGLSSQAMGDALGVSRVAINNVTSGRSPRLATRHWPRLAVIFDCTLDEIRKAAGECPTCKGTGQV